MALAFLAPYEMYWRGRGMVPAITDDPQLWALARASVRPYDPTQIALLGDSRMREGIDTSVFAESFNGHMPVELAVDGSSAAPVLDDLSRDVTFRGTIVCELTPGVFFGHFLSPTGKQALYLLQYREQTAATPCEAQLRTLVQSHLAFRLPNVSPRLLLGALARGAVPELVPPSVHNLPDRSAHADFSKCDHIDRLEQRMLKISRDGMKTITAKKFQAELDQLEDMVSRIHGRGGRVAFVYFPCNGLVRQLEDEFYPRREYWDVLAARTRAVTVHFEDYPELRHFHCPDGSHLDHKDAVLFTQAFGTILRAKLAQPAQSSNF
jgi:hypothetical protein